MAAQVLSLLEDRARESGRNGALLTTQHGGRLHVSSLGYGLPRSQILPFPIEPRKNGLCVLLFEASARPECKASAEYIRVARREGREHTGTARTMVCVQALFLFSLCAPRLPKALV